MGPIESVRSGLSWFAGAVLLAAAWWFGGWPWAVLWTLAFLVIARQQSPAAALAAAGPAFLWLALFHGTGDRRLFFPFSMHVGQASSPVLLAAVFFAIRIQQAATLHVLAVELVVAIAVLAIGQAITRQGPPGLRTRTLAAAAVAILALLGLLL